MAPRIREVGGGPATGLADQFVQLLSSILGGNASVGGGGTGPMARTDQSNPVGRTAGIAGVLNDILAGGSGEFGGALKSLITQRQGQDIADLRARFGASGGTAFGTPAAYAESAYRAKAAPEAATQIGSLQLQALLPLLQLAGGLSEKGISQRQTIAQPSAFTSFLGTIAPAIATIAPYLRKMNLAGGTNAAGATAAGVNGVDYWLPPTPDMG